ncbi:unnamed protein product [Sphenostylis stenocarpa]|uniref:Uncharacterized protein n=1 Tax=Sphenostylis stenocarpa TaxID=92480 RepID=A0AA86TDQ1_9FABA|nr:unnamed protein product [Sphenostylis stenocarpa]
MGVLILPMPPMTIEEVIPRTKKWWPPWDSRKQLSSIYCETGGADAGGVLTSKLRGRHYSILSWVKSCVDWQIQAGSVEHEQLELILGYPINHTRLRRGQFGRKA